MRIERGERQRRKCDTDDTRGLDDPRLIGLRGKREHPSLALGRAGFFKRTAHERSKRLAANARPAADANGHDPGDDEENLQINPGRGNLPLTIGEYALVEILAPGEVNLSVWDFRVDPQGTDNKNAILPLDRKP